MVRELIKKLDGMVLRGEWPEVTAEYLKLLPLYAAAVYPRGDWRLALELFRVFVTEDPSHVHKSTTRRTGVIIGVEKDPRTRPLKSAKSNWVTILLPWVGFAAMQYCPGEEEDEPAYFLNLQFNYSGYCDEPLPSIPAYIKKKLFKLWRILAITNVLPRLPFGPAETYALNWKPFLKATILEYFEHHFPALEVFDFLHMNIEAKHERLDKHVSICLPVPERLSKEEALEVLKEELEIVYHFAPECFKRRS